MNIKSVSRAVTLTQKCRVTLAAAFVSLLASHPVHALPDSFPQYPLQTGFTSIVPANVMLILDDSGSMGWDSMPVNADGYQDNRRGAPWPELRSYASNVLYYNPANEYRPWRKATMPGDPDERMPNATINSVSRNSIGLSSANYDLRGTNDAFFFIPRVANPKLWRARNNKAPALGGLPKHEYDLYRISKQGIVQRCKRSGSDCTLSSPDSDWETQLPANNKGRNNDQEVQNYANWYHYHRTRMKMAKAGASEAFGQLDRNVRVGYDRINSDSKGTNIQKIVKRIPYNTNGGLFEGANRTDFFNTLQGQSAVGGTPLRNALIRTGKYYETSDPYKDGSGNPLSCRKNFAILTTDGEWNGDDPKDRSLQTLAAIGNHYWKKDLRSDLANNVPKSTHDEANWQHMNTFGISIGVGGNLSKAPEPTGGPWLNPGPNKGALNIDDLARAAGEGRGRFFLANNTDEFAAALADALKDTAARDVSAANATSSGNQINNDLKHYGTRFHSGDWHGDVIQSSKDLAFDEKNGDWKLSTSFSGVNANFSSRTVLTSYGGTAQLFNKTTITDAVFGRSDHPAVSVADNIDYLRGVQSLEEGKGGSLRKRNHPIGDIVNASPFYALNTHTLYVGANDGMLHALDTKNGGKVLFSYVPKGINAEAMASLSSTKYEHRFLVDGNIDVSTTDVTANKNILLAALGRGGRGVFALDVTDPKAMDTAQVLWDNTTQDDTTNANMGYVLGRLRIRPGNGNKVYALVPNGIESPSGKAVLFAYELDANGAITETHELIADNGTDNGLMSLGMADLNGDGKIDLVYGGDLKGNLWRWNFSSDIPGAVTLLFTAVNDNGKPQPITGGITNARDPVTEQIFVGFGTGRLISEDDLPIEGGPALQPIQSLYGFIDPDPLSLTVGVDPGALISRSDLQERSIAYTGMQKGKHVRAFEENTSLDVGKKGWYIDLPANERVISDASMAGGEAMVVASIFPPDPTDVPGCESAAGNGFLNAVNLFTGTGPIANGYFPGYTTVTVPSANGGTVEVTIGSVGITEGMPSAPNVVCDNDACKVVVDKGNGHLALEDGPKLDGAAVEPHRLQWRSLR